MIGKKIIPIDVLGVRHQVRDRARVIFYLGVVLVLLVIALLISGNRGLAILFGGMAGLVMHWQYTYGCLMRVPSCCSRKNLVGAIRSSGYASIDNSDTAFKPIVHRLLYFDHQRIFICVDSSHSEATVTGPKYALENIRQRLMRCSEAQI